MQTRTITLLIAMLVTLGATALSGATRANAAGNPGAGGCGASVYPWGYNISCQARRTSPGSPRNAGPASDPGGGVVNMPCALYPVAGNPTHMLRVCPLPNPNGGLRYAVYPPGIATLVPVGGGPPVTPQELLAWARSQLALPLPTVRTAPPHGTDGLVGLPEWFWVAPGQWHPMSARVQVGGVWAQVTAHPARLEVEPGTGTSLACRGPGTPYAPRLAASAQQHIVFLHLRPVL